MDFKRVRTPLFCTAFLTLCSVPTSSSEPLARGLLITHTGPNSDTAFEGDSDNVAIYPLAIPLLAGPSAIMLVIVVTVSFAKSISVMVKCYAPLFIMVITT